MEDGKLIAASVAVAEGKIRVGAAATLFDAPFYYAPYGYSPAPDGNRFLFSAPVGGTQEPRPGAISIVLNRFGDWRSVR